MFQCHHGVPASFSCLGCLHHPHRFQCHHGVPASPLSCHLADSPSIVSMPPRRSCFSPAQPGQADGVACFNATTAFLLPAKARLLLRGEGHVSMPPRRSCFLPGGVEISLEMLFQCHHGVPASPSLPLQRRKHQEFQCHHGVPASRESSGSGTSRGSFQCHHGVPASLFFEDLRWRSNTRFNATTAFLLLAPHLAHRAPPL